MEFELLLERGSSNNIATYGRLFVLDRDNNVILSLVTLELPWCFNQQRISCIPTGKYVIEPHVSPSKGKCLIIRSVPARANILIHSGNYTSDTLGCVLVGTSYCDINHDGNLDAFNSRVAMASLLVFITTKTVISIVSGLANKEKYK